MANTNPLPCGSTNTEPGAVATGSSHHRHATFRFGQHWALNVIPADPVATAPGSVFVCPKVDALDHYPPLGLQVRYLPCKMLSRKPLYEFQLSLPRNSPLFRAETRMARTV